MNNADLMKIAVNGGGPEWVARVGEGLKGTMNQQGVIVLGSRRGLLRVEKGSTTLLTHVKAPDTRHSMPIFLPGGDRILFTITRAKPTITRWLAVFDMNDRSWRVLRPIPSRVEYIHGQLLYVQDGTLVARPFDLETLDFTGLERRLAAPVWHKTETGEAAFSASRSTVVVMPPPRTPPLQHVTSTGKVLGTVMAAGAVEAVAAARTSDQIALITGDDQGDAGLFVYPLDGRERVRLVQGKLSSPVFSHDDARLYYAAPATSTANIHVIRIAPVREERQTLPLPSEWIVAPRDISPDGQFLLFQKWENRDGDIWYAPLSDVKRAVAFVATTQDEGETARFSPDGRRVAFVARRGEEFSLYVAAFPPIGDLAQQVATNGWRARWSSDGRRLYFARDNAVMEADLATRRTREVLRMEQPVWLLETAPDGGFLVREAELGQDRTVVTRWWPHLSRHPLALSPR